MALPSWLALSEVAIVGLSAGLTAYAFVEHFVEAHSPGAAIASALTASIGWLRFVTTEPWEDVPHAWRGLGYGIVIAIACYPIVWFGMLVEDALPRIADRPDLLVTYLREVPSWLLASIGMGIVSFLFGGAAAFPIALVVCTAAGWLHGKLVASSAVDVSS